MARVQKNSVSFQNPIRVLRAIRGSPLWILTCVVCAGCTSSNEVPRYKVTGKVTYQGQPVEEGTITFGDPTAGRPDSSPLGPGGTYTVEVPAGDYQVSVSPPLVETKGTADSPPDLVPKQVKNIPKKYWVQESSGLSAQVVKEKRTFDFDLKP